MDRNNKCLILSQKAAVQEETFIEVNVPLLSLRGAQRRGKLGFSDRYQIRDCFAALAKTAFYLYRMRILVKKMF